MSISEQINKAADAGNRAEVYRLMSLIKSSRLEVEIGVPNDHSAMRTIASQTSVQARTAMEG